MKFVHIADVHMGMGFSTASFGLEKGLDRRREIKGSMLGVVTYCQDQGVDLLLIAGDLFEEDYVTVSDLKDLNGAFSQLTKTKVLISGGNHDPIVNKASVYSMIDWCDQVYIFGTKMESHYIQAINTEVWSFSWDKKYLPPFLLQDTLDLSKDRINLLMLHGDVYQENKYQYIDQKQFEKSGFDYIALGHIHKMAFLTPWLAYPGSLEALDFSETGDHGFIEGDIHQGNLTASFKPFAKRAFHKLSLEVRGDMTFEGISRALGDLLGPWPKQDFFRITLLGDLDPQVTLDLGLIKERYEASYYYIEVLDQTQLDLDIDALEKDYGDGLIGAYITAMKAKGLDDPVVADALKKGLRLLLEEQVGL